MKKKLMFSMIAVLALALVASVALAKRSSGAWLGVYTQDVDKRLVKSLDLKVDQGALVNDVIDDSPADLAGVEEDDVIIAVGGESVADPDDLIDLLDDAIPGDTATLTVQRGDKKLDLPVVLESRRSRRYDRSFSWNWDAPRAPRVPDAPGVPDVPNVPGLNNYYFFNGDEYGYIGVRLLDLSPEAAAALGADNGGVLVDEVEVGTPAEVAGVKPGDLIVSIDSDRVRDTEDIQDFVRRLDDGEVAKLGIVRDHKPLALDVKVEARESNYRWSRHHNWFKNSDLIELNDLFDSDEYRSDMEELQEELREMQKDLKELHEKLD